MYSPPLSDGVQVLWLTSFRQTFADSLDPFTLPGGIQTIIRICVSCQETMRTAHYKLVIKSCNISHTANTDLLWSMLACNSLLSPLNHKLGGISGKPTGKVMQKQLMVVSLILQQYQKIIRGSAISSKRQLQNIFPEAIANLIHLAGSQRQKNYFKSLKHQAIRKWLHAY